MRRLFSLFLAVLLTLSLAACGGTKASDKAVSVAKQAIEVADSYLDGDMEYDTVQGKLEELQEGMDYVDDLTAEDDNKAADFLIDTSLLLLHSDILTYNYDDSSDNYDKVLEARNELAKEAGLKKR